jgi:hypothetical protein
VFLNAPAVSADPLLRQAYRPAGSPLGPSTFRALFSPVGSTLRDESP